MQTFDLHTARLGSQSYPCPHHGTEECDCQMIVLMVYGGAAEPVTLILHGNDGQTWISVADSPSQQVDKLLLASILRALENRSTASE